MCSLPPIPGLISKTNQLFAIPAPRLFPKLLRFFLEIMLEQFATGIQLFVKFRCIFIHRLYCLQYRSETVTSSTFALNLGSYNYLGFGGKNNDCIDSVVAALYRYGVSTSTVRSTISINSTLILLLFVMCCFIAICYLIASPTMSGSALHTELESRVAAFVGKEAALVCGQGFGTNTSTLQALFHKVCARVILCSMFLF